jgi:hypothetical protein
MKISAGYVAMVTKLHGNSPKRFNGKNCREAKPLPNFTDKMLTGCGVEIINAKSVDFGSHRMELSKRPLSNRRKWVVVRTKDNKIVSDVLNYTDALALMTRLWN